MDRPSRCEQEEEEGEEEKRKSDKQGQAKAQGSYNSGYLLTLPFSRGPLSHPRHYAYPSILVQ